FSGLKVAYPMPDKSADSKLMAIKLFKGNRESSRFYSDRSGEIERALRFLHIPSDTSQPGVPQNNAVAERLVQDVLEGTCTSLLRAGLPPCFWDFACQHYFLMENIIARRKSDPSDGRPISPWELTHGEPFYGQLIACGATVYFKPSDTKSDSLSNMEPTSITGICVGYELMSGYKGVKFI
ncbi:MAG: hypothetical protein ACKPKO_19335, partial [Candidatus Fonsibacter sp.]